ncbi:MAG: hypothetical protein AAF589_03615 [Planctomycetota bacterium]
MQADKAPTSDTQRGGYNNARIAVTLAVLAAACSGCGTAAISERLVGAWVGEPDATAGEVIRPTAAPDGEEEAEPPAEPTDLEAFDFRITLEFAPRGSVVMWLNDKQKRIDGSWQVLSVEGDRAQIEFTDQPPRATENDGKPDARKDAKEPEAPKLTQRRFELRMDPDEDRFTLQEEGADKRFGRLVFRRAE